MFGTLLTDYGKAIAYLDTLDSIDAHHGMSDFRIEPVEDRFAPTGHHARGDDRYRGAN